ncbi:MAG: AI-2E family transporter, partial [Hyphomicrobiales bacterium]|nr:AI-2E family transporter [Hyphomicrobiales bacterium]
PKLVGDKVGLHPVWVILALMAGGALFGFTGVLLAVPVAAVIGVMIRFSISRYEGSRLYHGHDWTPGTTAAEVAPPTAEEAPPKAEEAPPKAEEGK